MIKKGYRKLGKKLLLTETNFEVHFQVGPVHFHAQDVMVTIMMIIVMRVTIVVEMMIGTVMERKETGSIEMMTEVVELVIHMVEREIIMAGILMNVMAEMVVIRMMSIEELKGIMTSSMVQEIPASVEAAPLMMMIAQLEMAVAELMIFLRMIGT